MSIEERKPAYIVSDASSIFAPSLSAAKENNFMLTTAKKKNTTEKLNYAAANSTLTIKNIDRFDVGP